MMDDKENRRKCFKCGCSPAADGVKLFRFTKPGTKNLLRCELWAKFVFPEGDYSSIEFQRKLYNEHRVLCERHFNNEDFTDASKKRLQRSAVPCYNKPTLPVYTIEQPGPSGRIPLANIINAEPCSSGTMNTEPGGSGTMNTEPGGSGTMNTDSGGSGTSHTRLTEKEKTLYKKCTKYVRQIYQLQNRIKHLKSKTILNTVVEDKAVKKLSEKVSPTFALLLQGQIRNFRRKLRGKRWSKEEKITALRIYKRSPTCYRLLRRLFDLPSETTLKNLLNKLPMGIGCHQSVLEVLKKYVKTQTAQDNEYILMFDEMSLKKHLNYNTKDDIVEGFQDHGTQGRCEQVAGYALVFMIGGIRKRVKQPIAHYFSSGFVTADRLAVLIKEVLHQCFEAGLNIAATVCDMDGVNRRALSILGATSEHPYIRVGSKDIVAMYDTPHLLKCFRNLFIKYDIECDTNINAGDKAGRGVAKWSHITKFHEIDSNNPNFVFAPSLKKDHLDPNTKQKMKVNLAAQVLSHSVAAGMFAKIADGSLPADAAVTANVVSNIDKLFDALNSDSKDLRRGKPYSTNLTATSPHLKLFRDMKPFFSKLKFVGCIRKPPSQEGWVWNLNAIERLWHNLHNKYKIKSLATRRIQQDPLENLFGIIRGNCGCNTRPTTGQFVAGLKTAILSNLSHIGAKGNCEIDPYVLINNFETMLTPPSMPKPTLIEPEPKMALSSSSTDVLSFEIDEALNENSSEIQACAYVCGYLLKKLPSDCEMCTKTFQSENMEMCHMFVEFKEYDDAKKSLNYATKEMVACVEYCATMINNFLAQKLYIKSLRKTIIHDLKTSVDFGFIKCGKHKEDNINIILNSIFIICTKRFCVLKNQSFAQEASALKLKNKMDIILHK